MSRPKDIVFRKVMKYADLPTAPRDFTAVVMQEIQSELHEAVINPDLGKLIQQHAIEKAPPDFSRMVMSGLQEAERKAAVYQPVISKKTGYAIAAVIALVVLLLSSNAEQHVYSTSKHNYYQILSALSSIPPVYLLTLFILCALLLADYLFGQSPGIMKMKSREV
jgi:hypothetical protein